MPVLLQYVTLTGFLSNLTIFFVHLEDVLYGWPLKLICRPWYFRHPNTIRTHSLKTSLAWKHNTAISSLYLQQAFASVGIWIAAGTAFHCKSIQSLPLLSGEMQHGRKYFLLLRFLLLYMSLVILNRVLSSLRREWLNKSRLSSYQLETENGIITGGWYTLLLHRQLY